MKIITGDIIELLPPGGVLFHQVNTLGKFGAGLALNIRRKWPEVAEHYERLVRIEAAPYGDTSGLLGNFRVSWLKADELTPWARRRGVCHLFAQTTIGRDRRHTNYTALARALHAAADHYAARECYFPHGMGCGLGGGDWTFVQALIEENFPNAIIVQYQKPEKP